MVLFQERHFPGRDNFDTYFWFSNWCPPDADDDADDDDDEDDDDDVHFEKSNGYQMHPSQWALIQSNLTYFLFV